MELRAWREFSYSTGDARLCLELFEVICQVGSESGLHIDEILEVIELKRGTMNEQPQKRQRKGRKKEAESSSLEKRSMLETLANNHTEDLVRRIQGSKKNTNDLWKIRFEAMSRFENISVMGQQK